MNDMIQLGRHLVRLSAVTAAHWDPNGRLYVYVSGGRYLGLSGSDAEALWKLLGGQGRAEAETCASDAVSGPEASWRE